MWSHYADKHSGICFGFTFEKAGGDGIIQLGVRYADKVEPRSYFTETIFSIYNWIFTKSKVWEYEEEVRRVYINKNGLIQFDKKEMIEIYYGVKVTEDQIKFIKELIKSNHYSNVRRQSCMKISPETFDLIETVLP